MRLLGIASAVLILLALVIWFWLQPSDFVLVVKVMDNQTGEADPSDVGRFTVQLSNNSRDTINLQLSSSSPDQGVPELDSLTFTGSDWDVPKTVSVIGQDEWIDDDDLFIDNLTIFSFYGTASCSRSTCDKYNNKQLAKTLIRNIQTGSVYTDFDNATQMPK